MIKIFNSKIHFLELGMMGSPFSVISYQSTIIKTGFMSKATQKNLPASNGAITMGCPYHENINVLITDY
jgi:hypothetical protein